MAKAEWGLKRTCPDTGKRFYDLNKVPIVSPYTGKDISPEILTEIVKKQSKDLQKAKEPKVESPDEILTIDDEDLILEDGDQAEELDDELLEDDDADTVPLEDITDVPSGDNEEN
mgnify:FL=1